MQFPSYGLKSIQEVGWVSQGAGWVSQGVGLVSQDLGWVSQACEII